ncbi:MAG: InlB B-repeat-containing protein [Treponema sp.]|nr:InlB B-repeat-containing protein [Treponema sp.]
MKTLKNYGLLISVLFSVLVLGMVLIGCSSDPDDTSYPGSETRTEFTYTHSSSRFNYTLVTGTRGRTLAGDTYTLTEINEGIERTSSGNVVNVSITGSSLTLQPSSSGSPAFTVIVLGNRIHSISGTITFTDGSTERGPGNLNPSTGGGGSTGQTGPTNYTVTFDVNDGDTDPPPNQTVTSGGKVTPVAEPTKQDWNFLYWANAANNNEWNFATDTVTGNITLKAIWTEDPVFIVSFNTGTGGSTVSSYNVKKDENAHDPGVIPTTTATSSTLPTTAGLYRGKGAPDVEMAQVFVEWRAPGGTSVFDFVNTPITDNITLTAHWEPAPRIGSVTTVPQAVSHANNNPGVEFTLFLSAGASLTSSQSLTGNARLTIIGLNAVTIRRTQTGSISAFFDIGGSGTSLTLGNHITLESSSNSAPVIYLRNSGHLIMLTGSKITNYTNNSTGFSGAAVDLPANTSFTLNGGEIIGNHSNSSSGGGVYVHTNAIFTMTAGKIENNTFGTSDTPMDVRFANFNAANHTKTDGTIGASNQTEFEGTGPGT